MTDYSYVQEREDLLAIFQAGVRAVQGRSAVGKALAEGLEGDWHLIAIGKAAGSMAEGAVDRLDGQLIDGLVISKTGHFDDVHLDERFQCLEAEHPVPGDGTIAAGQALLEYCENLPAEAQVLCCISGGASSLVEVLPEGMTLETLQGLNQALLAQGLDIGQMNRIRQALSLVKAGRLAERLKGHRVKALYISDVPGDDLATIGSGPLAPPATEGLTEFPPLVAELLKGIQPVPPAPADQGHVDHTIVASLDIAKQAAAEKARELGYPVEVDYSFMEGEAGAAAQATVSSLKNAEKGIHIRGGETVVMLPDEPGRGGRNQHFALAAALEIQGDDSLLILSAGTDGSDGPTEDAGGLVDDQTVMRGELAGLNARSSFFRTDAGTFLEASGDLVNTGPTGTNVMDLVVALKR